MKTKEKLEKEIKPLYGDGRIIELEKGALKKVKESYGRWIKKRYNGIKLPFCCETCKFVGNEWWHCHNENSFKCHINVNPDDLCSKWEPNEGLLIYLWIRKNKK